MNGPNAIDRLRDAVNSQVFGSEYRNEVLRDVAAVETLYRIAKEREEREHGKGCNCSLAAALDRIDGA